MTSPFRLAVRRSGRYPVQDQVVAVELSLPSDVREVEPAVELMACHCFEGVTPCARTAFRLRVTLAEALSNAILRGNREDPAKWVWVQAELTPELIRLSVRDEGDGCEPSRLRESSLPADPEDDGGRGLFIIKSLADEVEFDDRGNTIWMTLPRC